MSYISVFLWICSTGRVDIRAKCSLHDDLFVQRAKLKFGNNVQ